MSTGGPTRRTLVRRWLAQTFVWPVLDLRDRLRPNHERDRLYAAHHVPRRTRIRWGVLDAFDAARAPLRAAHLGPRHARLWAARLLPLVALPLLLLAGLAYATFGGGGEDATRSSASFAPAPRPAVGAVAGVSDSSAERAQRRALRRQLNAQLAARRRAERRRAARERAADRKRAARRRRAKRQEAPAAPAAPTQAAPPPVKAPPSSAPAAPPAQPPAASPPAPAPQPSAPPSGGGGGGGSGSPSRPQSSPGVEFDDSG